MPTRIVKTWTVNVKIVSYDSEIVEAETEEEAIQEVAAHRDAEYADPRVDKMGDEIEGAECTEEYEEEWEEDEA